jgi:hypothetical protein
LKTQIYKGDDLYARASASACFYDCENNMKILVFGGTDDAEEMRNSVIEFDITHQQFTILESNSPESVPSSRCHAFTKVINNNMIMYGGKRTEHINVSLYGSKYQQCRDMWSFDLKSHTWTELQPYGDVPGAYKFCCLISNDRLLSVSNNAVYICDLRVAAWERLQGEVILDCKEDYRDHIAMYYEETVRYFTLRFFCNQQSKEFIVFKIWRKYTSAFSDIEIICDQ